jgi:phosphatidylserine/phosphatidylglycerophosphate/cardiolipin synthase-like enzyme
MSIVAVKRFGAIRTGADKNAYLTAVLSLLSQFFCRTLRVLTHGLAHKQSASDRYSAVTFLANQGVSVRLNGRYAIQHSKFALIDGETVQTGSLNYTHSAFTRNAENVVVIRGESAVNQVYQQEFERLWAEGEPLNANY